jgi:hypothetical protein
MLGVNPQMLRNDDQVGKIRAQRAQAAAEKARQEQAQATGLDMAKSAHLLSQTDVNGTSALNRLLQPRTAAAPFRGTDGRPTP